jgi:hypothetical protein
VEQAHDECARHLAEIHERRDALRAQRDLLALEFKCLIVERRAMIASLRRRCDTSHERRRSARWPG